MYKTLAIILLLLSTFNCFSEEQSTVERFWDFGIGIGYGNSSNPFAGADDIPSNVTIDFSIYGDRFFFDNGEMGFTLIDKPDFGINIISSFNSERIYYSFFNEVGLNLISAETGLTFASNQPLSTVDENTIFTEPELEFIPSPLTPDFNPYPFGNITIEFDIPDKDYAFHLGLEFFFDTPMGSFSLQATKDVSDTHFGEEIIGDFNKTWKQNKWSINSSIGVHWKSDKMVNYYYGVNQFQTSRFIDVSYFPESTIDTFINITTNYRLTNHLSLVASIKYLKFGSEIRNSPIIYENSKHIIFTGLYYRF